MADLLRILQDTAPTLYQCGPAVSFDDLMQSLKSEGMINKDLLESKLEALEKGGCIELLRTSGEIYAARLIRSSNL